MRPLPHRLCVAFVLLLAVSPWAVAGSGAGSPTPAADKVVIDTDIGDDIDDAYAVALALRSPELDILGVTTAWGDTALRSQLVQRLITVAGREEIPVRAGVKTTSKTVFTQRAWALAGPPSAQRDAPGFLLEQVRRYPQQVTLIAIGPLTNVAAAIERDPATFRQLRRVVLMGGSLRRGYGDPTAPPTPPAAEYNIATDPAAARALFAAGVPIFMLPLDSTQLPLDDKKREAIATTSTPLTDALLVLTAEWQLGSHQGSPTLYDAVAVAFAIDPQLCPVTPLHVEIDDAGFTRTSAGRPNAHACLSAQPDAFFRFLMPRLVAATHPTVGN